MNRIRSDFMNAFLRVRPFIEIPFPLISSDEENDKLKEAPAVFPS